METEQHWAQYQRDVFSIRLLQNETGLLFPTCSSKSIVNPQPAQPPPSRPSPHPAEHSQSRGPAALGTTAGPNPCSCFSKSYSVPGYPGVPLLPTSPRDRPPELVNRGHTNAGNARDPGDRFLHSPVRSRASLCQPHSCRGEAVELFPLSHPA